VFRPASFFARKFGTSGNLSENDMRFGITSRMALMASALVLCMSGITGWAFYVKANRIITNRGLDDLTTDTCRVGNILYSDIRQERVDTWGLAHEDRETKKWVARELLKAVKNDDKLQVNVLVEELTEKVQKLFQEHPNYVRACYIYRDEEGDRVIAAFHPGRDGSGVIVRREPPNDVTSVEKRETDAFGLPVKPWDWRKPIAVAVRDLAPDNGGPARPALNVGCVVYETPEKEEFPCGLVVVSMDLAAGLKLSLGRPNRSDGETVLVRRLAYLMDAHGRLLVSPDGPAPADSGGSAEGQAPIRVSRERDADPSDSLVHVPRIEDGGRLYQSARLPRQPPSDFALHAVMIPHDVSKPESGLLLVQASSYDDMNAAIDAERNSIFLLMLGLSAGAAGLAALFSLMLTLPLKRITTATKDFARGTFAGALPVTRRDEIGILARSFQGMVGEIQKRDAELRESEARTRTIVETAAEGIVTFDEKGLIRSYNPAARDIFGYEEEEVVGQSVQMLLALPNPEGANGQGDLEASGKVTLPKEETTGRRKDATTFPMKISTSATAVSPDGLQVCIIRDVTERKRAEDEIKQLNASLERRVQERTTELQQLNVELLKARDVALASIRAKDTFLANMSHELRTPLNHIIGFCQLLELAGLYEDTMTDVNKIRTAGNHLLALINDILDFSKMEAGKLPIEATDFNAAELAWETAEFTQTLASKKSNKLVVECPKDLGEMHSDRNRLRQVLNNLLSNACKFTERGTITLRAWREVHEDGDWLVFEAADTGIGMTPEQLGRLFQPFEQADSSIARRFGGTGLGLMLSRSLCRAMGGDINVTSTMGQGSVFSARLPARLPEDKGSLPRNGADGTPPRTAEPVAATSTNLVLVIDDDPAVLELMERFLGKAGFTVRTAASGEEGLRLAKLLRPAVITLDTVMPSIDGWAVLAALKTDLTTAHIPVIMATMIDDKSRGFALGAADYITKPIAWDRLSAILNQHCPASSGTVLVVDDDPEAREVLWRMLEGTGWQVVEAEHGLQALEQVKQCRPAVILLDLMMPEMDGFEFVHELRRTEGCLGIPIIVLTAKEVTLEDRQELNGCVVKILQKGSINQDELFQEIQRQVTHGCRAAVAKKERT
jgi:PAS domain S-box-containing protein